MRRYAAGSASERTTDGTQPNSSLKRALKRDGQS
ncbi:conserved hypothetical protein [Neisseria gonorrhoeae SK-92-679]|nr:conserved hypothetical protein [Neisseria gonorrhoeae SK-92-679]